VQNVYTENLIQIKQYRSQSSTRQRRDEQPIQDAKNAFADWFALWKPRQCGIVANAQGRATQPANNPIPGSSICPDRFTAATIRDTFAISRTLATKALIPEIGVVCFDAALQQLGSIALHHHLRELVADRRNFQARVVGDAELDTATVRTGKLILACCYSSSASAHKGERDKKMHPDQVSNVVSK
jgi:hypothetical protein